ncbi:MAG: YciI family protein [Myxococcota bacterium]
MAATGSPSARLLEPGRPWHLSAVLFLIQCFDGASGSGKRPGARPDHLAYLESQGAQLKLAGPLLGDAGPVGSVFILEADDLAAAKAFADADPYLAAGVFERREITAMRVSLGAWAD